MYKKELEKEVHMLFESLKKKVEQIVIEESKNSVATERIMRLVSSAVSAEADGYMVELYAGLVNKVKEEEFFKNPENLNAFYRLNLREDLNQKYQFNIENIDSYKKGIGYKEINKVYASAGVAAGTLAVGGILKYALTGVVGIPFAVIIAGAIAMACTTYFAVSLKNKKEYRKEVNKFLKELENDILDWFVDVEVYFNQRVRSLYK